VRERYDQLEHKDLPKVVPNSFVENEDKDNDNDDESDVTVNPDNSDNDEDSDSDSANTSPSTVQMQPISCPHAPRFARNINLLSV
jgi:hypothetical protein